MGALKSLMSQVLSNSSLCFLAPKRAGYGSPSSPPPHPTAPPPMHRGIPPIETVIKIDL